MSPARPPNRPGPRFPRQLPSLIPTLVNELRKDKTLNMSAPGRTLVALKAMPAWDRKTLHDAAVEYENEDSKGRHGNTKSVCDRYGVDEPTAKRIHEGFEVDTVCLELQSRKSDAQLPPEPVTRRDIISAAISNVSEE